MPIPICMIEMACTKRSRCENSLTRPVASRTNPLDPVAKFGSVLTKLRI